MKLTLIPVVISTCPKFAGRAQALRDQLLGLGFTEVAFHIGNDIDPYWHGLNDNLLAILQNLRPPFITMEDDASATQHWRSEIDIPDCDWCYLGGTRNAEPCTATDVVRIPGTWRDNLCVRPVNQDFVQVLNMHSAHAVLWPKDNPDVIATLERYKRDMPCDVILAREQAGHCCLLPRQPLFYQGDGHNDSRTKDLEIYLDLVRTSSPPPIHDYPEGARRIVVADRGPHLTPERDLRLLIHEASLTRGGIIEVGCRDGTTTLELSLAFPDRPIYGVDFSWTNICPQQAGERIRPEDFCVHARNRPNVVPIFKPFEEIAPLVFQDVGVVFIDGDHTYRCCAEIRRSLWRS